MSENEIVAESWNHLQELLFTESWNDALQRFRSPFAFRGLSHAEYRLATGLMRLAGEYWKLERPLLRNFRKYAHRDVVERDSDWHWLSIAQHHGLPTRLLDWTFSPYVALHFVTAAPTNLAGCDGVVWAVNFEKLRAYLPDGFRAWLEREDANGFSVEMLSRIHADPFTLHEISGKELVLFFEPPSMDGRIVNQFALFSMMSHPRAYLDDWLRAHAGVFRRIIIPAALKWEVRDKLDQANISERVLFPGLDGLTSWLRRHYSPGPRKGT